MFSATRTCPKSLCLFSCCNSKVVQWPEQHINPIMHITGNTFSAAGAMASKLSKIYFLICNKFGCIDNTAVVNNLDETHGRVQPQSSPRYGCDNAANSSAGAGPRSSRDNIPEHTQATAFDALVHEIQELREDQSHLDEYFENVKAYYQHNYTGLLEGLEEEQYRYDILAIVLSGWK